jgi:hypothetical protein
VASRVVFSSIELVPPFKKFADCFAFAVKSYVLQPLKLGTLALVLLFFSAFRSG